jgi:amino acid adenylation domain-containing protein
MLTLLSSPLIDLASRAESSPDRVLLVDDSEQLTYAETHRRVRLIGTYLRSIGIRKGDRVAVLMHKAPSQAIAQLGVLDAEAILVPVSDLLKAEQVQHILRDCAAAAVIAAKGRLGHLQGYAAPIQVIPVGVGSQPGSFEAILDSGEIGPAPTLIGADSAAIIYTSGSTGLPKGIVLTHRNLWDGARIVTTYLSLKDDDRLAQILSLNFDYGLNQLFGCIRVGAQLHFHNFQFPADVFNFLRRNCITTLALMPIFLNRLFDPQFFRPAMAENIDNLRRITTSGGRVQRELVRTIRQIFPKTDLYLMYGLSEAFRSTYLPPDQVDGRPDSIGRAIPDAQILVLDENGKECPPNVPGQLVHRGGVIARGYWNAPEKTAERFKTLADASGNAETVVYSGDLVRRDSDGYLYFIGRNDNMIKTAGHRVSPEEVERAAETIDGVEHGVAFGREHAVLGEEVVLVCIAAENSAAPEEGAIRRLLHEKLPSYMVPNTIHIQRGFAVTPGNQGKVDRTSVRRAALEALGRK